jgi:hypothetical protein
MEDPMIERITDPGKFEGQLAYMPKAYEQYLDGFCDDDGHVITVTIDWEGRRRDVRFIVDDMGFVREV